MDRAINHYERCGFGGQIHWFHVDGRSLCVKKRRFQKHPDSCGRGHVLPTTCLQGKHGFLTNHHFFLERFATLKCATVLAFITSHCTYKSNSPHNLTPLLLSKESGQVSWAFVPLVCDINISTKHNEGTNYIWVPNLAKSGIILILIKIFFLNALIMTTNKSYAMQL